MATLILAYIIARWDDRNALPRELFFLTGLLDFLLILGTILTFAGEGNA